MFLETMERIDRVLIDSSLEREAIVKALEGWDEAGGKDRERQKRCGWRWCVIYSEGYPFVVCRRSWDAVSFWLIFAGCVR